MDKEAIMDLEVDKNNNSDIHHVNINNNIKSKNYTREATDESSLNPQLIREKIGVKIIYSAKTSYNLYMYIQTFHGREAIVEEKIRQSETKRQRFLKKRRI